MLIKLTGIVSCHRRMKGMDHIYAYIEAMGYLHRMRKLELLRGTLIGNKALTNVEAACAVARAYVLVGRLDLALQVTKDFIRICLCHKETSFPAYDGGVRYVRFAKTNLYIQTYSCKLVYALDGPRIQGAGF